MKPRPETEDLDDLLETTKAIRATKRRHVRSLDDFIAACAASPNLERMGGLAVDMTTKSMVTIEQDDYAENPFEARGCEPPLLTYYGGRQTGTALDQTTGNPNPTPLISTRNNTIP